MKCLSKEEIDAVEIANNASEHAPAAAGRTGFRRDDIDMPIEAEDPDMPFIIEHQTEWNAYLESIERVRRITAQESPLPPFRDRGEMTEQVKVKRNSAE